MLAAAPVADRGSNGHNETRSAQKAKTVSSFECLVLALNVVWFETAKCPEFRAKRTLRGHHENVAFDPSRSLGANFAVTHKSHLVLVFVLSLANKPLIRRAEFAASGAARPHSTAITARQGREAVRHICD